MERSAAGPQASSRTSRSAAPGQPDIDYIMITAGQQPQRSTRPPAGQPDIDYIMITAATAQHQASRPGPAELAAIQLIWVLFGVCRR